MLITRTVFRLPTAPTLVFATLTAACADAPDTLVDWYEPTELVWNECEEVETGYASQMECATLAVPIDWSEPGGLQLTLDLARFPARGTASRRGVVVVLSGGPGGSGIDDLPYVADGLPEVLDRFDLIAHEPRTALALRTVPPSCRQPSGSIVDLPTDAVHYAEILEPLVEAVQRCRLDDVTGLIDHLDGLSQALDIEAIRRALQEDELSLTAQSYGGVVVATYARMLPERVRAAYVDGSASHPDYPFVRGSGTQVREFRRFAEWCETSPECALHGEDVIEAWVALTDEANRSPIPATSERYGDGRLSGVQLHFLTRRWRDPGPGNTNWLALAENIDRARRGDASAFIDWAYGNLSGWTVPVVIAMQCPDGAEGRLGFEDFRGRLERHQQADPLLYGVKLMGLSCGAWPGPLANPPSPLPGQDLPPFLGAGTRDNDLVPTQQLLEHIPGSVTIAVPGSGHVVYLPGAADTANQCVLDHLSRYLLDLALPPLGTECEWSDAAG